MCQNNVYTNNGLTFVQFGLSSIKNSATLIYGRTKLISILLYIKLYRKNYFSLTQNSSIGCSVMNCGYYNLINVVDVIINSKKTNQHKPDCYV